MRVRHRAADAAAKSFPAEANPAGQRGVPGSQRLYVGCCCEPGTAGGPIPRAERVFPGAILTVGQKPGPKPNRCNPMLGTARTRVRALPVVALLMASVHGLHTIYGMALACRDFQSLARPLNGTRPDASARLPCQGLAPRIDLLLPAAGGLLSREMAVSTASTAPPRHNLVLGMAWNLQIGDLDLFARSLRQVAPAADVVLLAKDVSTETQRLAHAWQIQLLPLNNCYFGLCKSADKRNPKESRKRIRNYLGMKLVNGLLRAAYPLARLGYTHPECRELGREIRKLIVHTYSSRFVQYLDFLRNQSARYDKVMLSDVRDVFFQADPFARIPDHQLWMFQEEGPHTLGSDRRNRRWVLATFGRKVLRQIEHQRILCAGITIGSYANIVGYLQAMEPELLTRSPVYIPDQGIHNAMAYTGVFKHLNPVVVKNGDGPVLTVGLMTEAQFKWDDAGRLVDAAGVPYAVIHQFDRHPKLAARLQRLVG